MEKRKTIQELKEEMGFNHHIVDGRAQLEKMIDPNKYYLVVCHSLPFKGSTILKRNFQPSFILQDLGYNLTKEQWEIFNQLKLNNQWIEHLEIPQQQQTQQPTTK